MPLHITDDRQIFWCGQIESLASKKSIEIIGGAEHGLDLLEKQKYLQPDLNATSENLSIQG